MTDEMDDQLTDWLMNDWMTYWLTEDRWRTD